MEGDALKVTSEAREKNTGPLSRIHIGLYVSPGADATIKVPRDSRYNLRLATPMGRVTVTALNGSSMDLSSDDGSIDLYSRGAADSVTAITSKGNIKAKYNATKATFESSDGSIEISY